MLGGSSSINFNLYLRGFNKDFDHWSNLGNLGWDYKSVLPYFKKSEANQYAPFVEYKNGKYHNASGPLKVDFYQYTTNALDQVWLNAQREEGNPIIQDINANQLLGTFFTQATVANGRRQSTAKAFLIPAMNRTNLHIIKHAFHSLRKC